jgi:alkylhydroperoxidase domain protein/CMD domain protein
MTATTAATPTATNDVISTLAGIAPGSPAAELRAQRPEAMQHAQGSYTALFDPAELVGLSPIERFAIALRVATIHAASEAAEHYRQRLIEAGASQEIIAAAALEDAGSGSQPDPAVPPRLQAILAHADLLSTHPVDASPDDLQALADAGLATVEIVVLSQIVAFVSFQVRVVAALQLITGRVPEAQLPVGSEAPIPGPGSTASEQPASTLPAATVVRPDEPLNRPPAFTRDQLEWVPWLVPLDMADATPAQVAALEGRRGNSPYFRLLALDADVLTERTATDLGIFYTHGGAPRAERELSAAATSRLNGCIYCASVHARLSAQLSKREADVDRLLDQGVGSIPDLGLDDRWQAVVTLAVELARTPMAATTEHVARLRELGLSDLEILDVSQAASFFSWANRLMLTLGEPYYAES